MPRYRVGLVALLVVLLLAAVPYLDTGVSRAVVLLAMLLPFALALWSPILAVAFLMETAPLTDPLATYFAPGTSAPANPGGVQWIEPMFLGVAAGIVTRLLWRSTPTRALTPAGRFYAAIVLCALGIQLAGYVIQWRSLVLYPLDLLWWSVPSGQLAPENTLRATLMFLAAPCWLWLVRNAVDGPDDESLVWLAWLGGALIVTACGIWMWTHGQVGTGNRIVSFLEDANSYGSYLVLTVFVAWSVLQSERGSAVRALAALVLVLTAWMLLMSGSKVAIVATFAGAAMAVALHGRTKRRWSRVAALGIILLASWAGIAAVAGQYPPAVVTGELNQGGVSSYLPEYFQEARWAIWAAAEQNLPEVATRVIKEVSDPSYLLQYFRETRWAAWSASTRAFLAHPTLGIGPGLLCQNLGEYYRPSDWGWLPAVENAHNYFLQMAAETGFLGVVGLVWLILTSVRPAFTDADPQAAARRLRGVGALGYILTLLTGHALLLSRQIVLFWGFLGVVSASHKPLIAGRIARYSAWLAVPLFLATLWWDPVPQACQQPVAARETVAWEFGLGFHPDEGAGGTSWRWMKDAGELDVCNRTDRPLVADVTLTVQSFAEAREVSVCSRGRVLADITIGPDPTKLIIPGVRLVSGATALLFVPSPAARRVDAALHTGDRRRVSLGFSGEPIIAIRAP